MLVLYLIVMFACAEPGSEPCLMRALEQGITYPTLDQCQSALARKATDLLNAQASRGLKGEITCVEITDRNQT